MMPDPDVRALAALRADAEFYRRMFKDFYRLAIAAHDRIAVLEREKADAYEELRRYTSRQTAPDGRGKGL